MLLMMMAMLLTTHRHSYSCRNMFHDHSHHGVIGKSLTAITSILSSFMFRLYALAFGRNVGMCVCVSDTHTHTFKQHLDIVMLNNMRYKKLYNGRRGECEQTENQIAQVILKSSKYHFDKRFFAFAYTDTDTTPTHSVEIEQITTHSSNKFTRKFWRRLVWCDSRIHIIDSAYTSRVHRWIDAKCQWKIVVSCIIWWFNRRNISYMQTTSLKGRWAWKVAILVSDNEESIECVWSLISLYLCVFYKLENNIGSFFVLHVCY